MTHIARERRSRTRLGFALRLLDYHGGGGSRVYALGSHLAGNHPIPYDMVRLARDELLREAARPHREGHGSRWVVVAERILAARLTRWMQTGVRPWLHAPVHTARLDPVLHTLIQKEN